MRPVLVALLLAAAIPAGAEPSKLATPIEIRPGFLTGTKYYLDGRDVSSGRELRFVFRDAPADVERDRLLEKAESHYIIGNAVTWPGIVVGGLALRTDAALAIVGIGVMVVGNVISSAANGEKRRAVDRYNAGLVSPVSATADSVAKKRSLGPIGR